MNSDSEIYKGLDYQNIPSHVAIIMDGNGRWARQRFFNRVLGHEKGAEVVRSIVELSRKIGIKFLTLYAFSTENWDRPADEVSTLMLLLKKFLGSETKEMVRNNICLKAIGQIEQLPKDVIKALEKAMLLTEDKNGMVLTLALSYGARSEIIWAVKKIAKDAVKKKVDPEKISEELISNNLYTACMPDPDLLIRTSGEMRLSNFLLWQIAYAELFVTKTLWPDFTKEEFISIIKDYQARERRFGKI